MTTDSAYPGAALGLPEHGRGSLASFPRRLLAILIDWLACTFIALAVLGVPWGQLTGTDSLVPLLFFAIENILLVGTAGFTLGHRILGLQVHRWEALTAKQGSMPGQRAPGLRAPGLRAAAIRTVLLCLLIPPFIVDRHGRGLHDRVAGTGILRSR